MLKTLAAAPTAVAAPEKTAVITVIRDGQPIALEVDYALYLQLQEALDEWQANQRAAAIYEAFKKDPSRGQDWEEFKAELVADGLLDAE